MNYKTVSKKKKKNTVLLVVALVLSLVLVGGAVAGIGYAFDWWNFGKEEVKEVPTSSYNLNVESIDDIIGVEFTRENFAFRMDQDTIYEEALKEWEQNASTSEKPVKAEDEYIFMGALVLNVEDFGVDYKKPESGLYDITIKLNGKEYTYEKVSYDASVDTDIALNILSDFDGKPTEENIAEGDIDGFAFNIGHYAFFSEEAGLPGESIMFLYFSHEEAFETIELVKFDLVEAIEDEEETEDDVNCTEHIDENVDSLCDVCGATLSSPADGTEE